MRVCFTLCSHNVRGVEKLKTMLEAGGFLIKPLHKNSLRKKKI
ncbi:hypothetical protein TERTU_2080 [Teredinibacter turnerae T7901]|uniref:Uncharacterized protein n=1 Tax=Teredinibacter turnerae (strain ATCC 39867 / T7901) TaxID=377629 RepID=C5BIU2_TERTT|nr:hypothetical protein TERTU_2080 [Teredinibacter turnerae T7901]